MSWELITGFLIGWILGAWMGVRGGRKQVLAQFRAMIPGISMELIKALPKGDVTIQVVDVNGDIVADGTTATKGRATRH